jgi:hypothetical protein
MGGSRKGMGVRGGTKRVTPTQGRGRFRQQLRGPQRTPARRTSTDQSPSCKTNTAPSLGVSRPTRHVANGGATHLHSPKGYDR